MSKATLLRPFLSIESPGTKDGRQRIEVIYHFEVGQSDLLWSGRSHSNARTVAEQWREDAGLLVVDKVRGHR